MSVGVSYGLRWRRKFGRARALLKRRELRLAHDNTRKIAADDILLFCTLRDEIRLLPFFLQYYRKLGVSHFLFVDNGSTDGSSDFLAQQSDVSVWHTHASYARSRHGVDWLNDLQSRFGHGHWTLTVDVDEFFVYPFCDTRPLRALADWLDASSVRSFGTMLLDMYPNTAEKQPPYKPGTDPLAWANWFDSGNYTISPNPLYKNLWIQGGPRARAFFADNPAEAPALNKIPFVKWHRRYTYVSSTHMMLPRGLNLVYDQSGGEKASGVLLHAKFLDHFAANATTQARRAEHFRSGREYQAYCEKQNALPALWSKWSTRYQNWQQLEELGLMSKGNWA